MSEFWTSLVETFRFDLLLSLIAAVIMGGAIGLERELKGKAAGLRTNILICVGSTLFTQLSLSVAGEDGDPGRIAAQIVTGVGFIGAGTILQARGHITGLTSAATIWLVAAIGVAIGAGALLEAAGATLLVVLVLAVLGVVERRIERYGTGSRLVLEVDPGDQRIAEIERVVREAGLRVQDIHSEPKGSRLVIEVGMRGPSGRHERAKAALLQAPFIRALSADEE